MASRNDKQNALSGSLRLVPPGDKIGDGDALLLDNFRVDKAGSLVTRRHATKVCSAGSGIFHSLKRSGNARYAGIGSSVYYGAELESTVTGGFDGEPLGIAFYQSAAWIMNRGKQTVATAQIPYRWGVPAPASAPHAVGQDTLQSTLADFLSGVTVEVSTTSPTGGDDPTDEADPTATFTESAMEDGTATNTDICIASFDDQGTKMLMLQAGTVRAYAAGGDSSINGETADEDVIRVMVFCSDPTKITSLSVFVRSGELEYIEYVFNQPQKFLNQGLNSWTQLRFRRRLNLDDWNQRIAIATEQGNQQTISDVESQFATEIQTPTFQYLGRGWPQSGIGGVPPKNFPPSDAMLRVNWQSLNRIGVSFTVSDPCQVSVGLFDVTGTVGANTNGAMQFFATFVNALGHEGNPSPASNSVVTGTQSIQLTGIPVCPDATVDCRIRNLYAIGGQFSHAYQIGQLFDNSSSTFTWKTTVRAAQADNIEMPTDHDLPPKARGVIGPYLGKLIAFSTVEHPARFFWSPSGSPSYFPGADDDLVGNWEDVGGDDDEVIQATDHKQALLFYKNRSIWRLVGDPETSDPTKSNAADGLVGPKAVCNAGAYDFAVLGEGVYRVTLDTEEKISDAIDPIFKGDYVQLSDGEYLPPCDLNNKANIVTEIIGDRLRVCYPEVGSSQPNVVLIYHTSTGRWAREKYTGIGGAFTVMHNEGAGTRFIMGGVGSNLYALETFGWAGDDGHAYDAVWQSRFYDQDLPDNFKIYTDVELDCETGFGQATINTISIYCVFDNGTKILVGTAASSDGYGKPRFTAILPIPASTGSQRGYKAKNCAMRIEVAVTGQVTIHGAYIHWYPEERVARTFDSGPTNFGIPERVKEVDYFETYLTASGQSLRRTFSSDLPGNVLTLRQDANFNAPNGRGTVRFRPASVDGRNFRLMLDESPSGSTFQVHQLRARMRVIGEYIDGTIGEYYESPEFSVAPGRVGELKDFLLDYDASAAGGRIEVYSDLPGTALTARRTLALPAQTTRGVYVFPLESGADAASDDLPYGQLFKVRIYPPPGGILRLHGRAVFRARLIGVYFNGTNGEIWETQSLDLLGGMAVFREVEITCQTAGPMFFEMDTELPGQNMATIGSFTVDSTLTTAGRLPFIFRLPGSAKGRLEKFRLRGSYIARVFGVKVLARRLQVNAGGWEWYTIPMEATPDAWAEIAMPVRETPSEFSWVDLPVDAIE